jgi:hypothetical protein
MNLYFLILVLLSFTSVRAQIKWVNNFNNNGQWAMGCDWPGNDLSSLNTPVENCGQACAATLGCTKFTWLSDGTCLLKSGSASISSAVVSKDPNSFCSSVASEF